MHVKSSETRDEDVGFKASATIEISIGELFDRITILTIKLARIKDEGKLHNIKSEYNSLAAHLRQVRDFPELEKLVAELTEVNEKIWDVEEQLHALEKAGKFDQEFIQFARGADLNNDKRSDLKRKIILLSGSTILEEKSY